MQGTQVPSLVGELRSRKPRGAAKNKNKFLKKVSVFIPETNTILQSNYPSTRNKLKKKKLSAASNRAGPAFMSMEPRGQHSRRLRVPPSVVGVGASGLAEAGEQPQGPPDAPHQLPQLPSHGHFHTIQAPPQPTLLFWSTFQSTSWVSHRGLFPLKSVSISLLFSMSTSNGVSLWLWCCLPQPGALGPWFPPPSA